MCLPKGNKNRIAEKFAYPYSQQYFNSRIMVRNCILINWMTK